jgi:hypothetical protein
MLTYALGRGLEYYDKCAVDAVLVDLEKNDYRLSALVAATIKSEPFQKRMASGERSASKPPSATESTTGDKP